MAITIQNASSVNYPHTGEARPDARHTANDIEKNRRANEYQQRPFVLDAYKVERLNHAVEARELRPITYDSTRLNKVRTFLSVAQNGKQTQFVDLYI